jgi:hypothetical protein
MAWVSEAGIIVTLCSLRGGSYEQVLKPGYLMDIAAELKKYQAALHSRGTDPAPLASLARNLVSLSHDEFVTTLEVLHIAANDPAYSVTSCDCDFRALLLEALADTCGDDHSKRRLYLEAKQRAEIFASYATSGGEGLARSQEVERIACKLAVLKA